MTKTDIIIFAAAVLCAFVVVTLFFLAALAL